MPKLNWLKKTKWQEHLTDDLLQLRTVIGEEALLRLIMRFAGRQLLISTKPIREGRREYILAHPNTTAPELARLLGCSVSLVQKTRNRSERAK